MDGAGTIVPGAGMTIPPEITGVPESTKVSPPLPQPQSPPPWQPLKCLVTRAVRACTPLVSFEPRLQSLHPSERQPAWIKPIRARPSNASPGGLAQFRGPAIRQAEPRAICRFVVIADELPSADTSRRDSGSVRWCHSIVISDPRIVGPNEGEPDPGLISGRHAPETPTTVRLISPVPKLRKRSSTRASDRRGLPPRSNRIDECPRGFA